MEHATENDVRSECRILIVEDQVLSAKSLELMLGRAGYRHTTIVHTGTEALRVLDRSRVDLVLMDVGLSEGRLEGIETVEKIRITNDVPVVYITARSDDEAMIRARKTRPYGYVVKPYHEAEVIAAIDIAMHLHTLQAEAMLNLEWLSTALTSIADAVIATDQAGCIRFMNPEAEKLTGWHLIEASGMPAFDVLHLLNETIPEPVGDPVRDAIAQGKKIELLNGLILSTRSGSEIPIQCTISPMMKNNHAEITGAVVVFRSIMELKKERERLMTMVLDAESQKRALERYFPENLVDLLVDEGHLAELGGKNIRVTVMICDIRNSTGIAETMSAANFASLLSDFFSGLMDLAYANGGSVNKLLGDGMLLTFGCPIPGDGDARDCVRLALQFREYVRTFNEIRPDYLRAPLVMGIGIATGPVFAGNIGSARHMEYTVLGNAVNTASRLEKLTKELGRDIAIDTATYVLLNDELEIESLGSHRLPGKKEEIEVFHPARMA